MSYRDLQDMKPYVFGGGELNKVVDEALGWAAAKFWVVASKKESRFWDVEIGENLIEAMAHFLKPDNVFDPEMSPLESLSTFSTVWRPAPPLGK